MLGFIACPPDRLAEVGPGFEDVDQALVDQRRQFRGAELTQLDALAIHEDVTSLPALPYLAAVIAMLVVSWGSDKLQKRKRFVWPPLLVASIAFYASYVLGAEHFWWSYTLLVIAGACMYAPYGPFFAIVPEILPANVAGGAMALINSMGALGSFGGSYLVGYLNSSTGSPGASYLLMSGALLLSVVLTMLLKPGASDRQRAPLPTLELKVRT